jgi:hypothetical protein
MTIPKSLFRAVSLMVVFAGAVFLAPPRAATSAPDGQDAAATAKALADALHDQLGFDAGAAAAGAAEMDKPVLYPIKVRGGGIPLTVSTIRRAKGGVVVFAHFKFKRGPKAAGLDGKGLGPGECAWVDRRLNPDEPCELLFYGFDTKIAFKPGSSSGGYEIAFSVRSNKPGLGHPWRADFFQSFADPAFVTEFWVTKSKDSKYLICGLD